MTGTPGTGHPLPASKEARHGQVPEHLEEEKGKGDNAAAQVTPHPQGVEPSGRPYEADPDV